jgi:hypothetical protein
MPDKHVITCTVCGKDGATVFRVKVDRRMDAAGSMEDVWERIDLCPDHTSSALRILLHGFGYGEARNWVREMQLEGKGTTT